MCKHQDATGGVNKATEYAITRNGATSSIANANLTSGTVVVTATVQQDTFFAGLIGISQTAPRAVATAKCSSPISGMGIMPIGWSCRPPVGEQPGESCVQKFGPGNLYIVMDSKKVDEDILCDDPTVPGITPGYLDCDMNDDGVNDLLAGGDRSWLNLEGGGGGAANMKDWVCNGYPDPFKIHTWVPGNPGTKTSVFFAVGDCQLNKDVVVPVYNRWCNGTPSNPVGVDAGDPCGVDTKDTIVSASGEKFYYHIISFAIFHVTCIQGGSYKGPCPGHNAAVAAGAIKDNDKTIEGYFKEGILSGYGGGTTNAGALVVNLVK